MPKTRMLLNCKDRNQEKFQRLPLEMSLKDRLQRFCRVMDPLSRRKRKIILLTRRHQIKIVCNEYSKTKQFMWISKCDKLKLFMSLAFVWLGLHNMAKNPTPRVADSKIYTYIFTSVFMWRTSSSLENIIKIVTYIDSRKD